jgi:hypothetical protein
VNKKGSFSHDSLNSAGGKAAIVLILVTGVHIPELTAQNKKTKKDGVFHLW